MSYLNCRSQVLLGCASGVTNEIYRKITVLRPVWSNDILIQYRRAVYHLPSFGAFKLQLIKILFFTAKHENAQIKNPSNPPKTKRKYFQNKIVYLQIALKNK